MKKVLSRLARVGRSSAAPGGDAADPQPQQRPAALVSEAGRPLSDLQRAVWDGDLARLRTITDASAVGLLARDAEGLSLLHLAAARGHCQVAELLLSRGLPLEGQDQRGDTPLLKAVEADSVPTVRLLLERGANANHANHQRCSGLQASVRRGADLVAEVLLQHGADVDQVDQDGHTALQLAVLSGNGELAEALLRRGADLAPGDADGRSALHLAAAAGHAQLVRLLLEAGADPAAADKHGATAAEVAAAEGFPSLQDLICRLSQQRPSTGQLFSGRETQRSAPGTPRGSVSSSVGMTSPASPVVRTPVPAAAPAHADVDADSDSWSDDEQLDFAPATRAPARPLPACFLPDAASPPPRRPDAGGDVTICDVSGVQRLPSSDDSDSRRLSQGKMESRLVPVCHGEGNDDGAGGCSPRGGSESWDAASAVLRQPPPDSWSGSDPAVEEAGPGLTSPPADGRPRSPTSPAVDDNWGDLSPIPTPRAVRSGEEPGAGSGGAGGERSGPADGSDSWGDLSPIPTPRAVRSGEEPGAASGGAGGERSGPADGSDSWGDLSPIPTPRAVRSGEEPGAASGGAGGERSGPADDSDSWREDSVELRPKLPDIARSREVDRKPATDQNGSAEGRESGSANLPAGQDIRSNLSMPHGEEDSWGDVSPILRKATCSKLAKSREVYHGSDTSPKHSPLGSTNNLYIDDNEDVWDEDDRPNSQGAGTVPNREASREVGASSPVKQGAGSKDSWGDTSPVLSQRRPACPQRSSVNAVADACKAAKQGTGSDDDSWGDEVQADLPEPCSDTVPDRTEGAVDSSRPTAQSGPAELLEEDSWGDDVSASGQPVGSGAQHSRCRLDGRNAADVHDMIIEKVSVALSENTAPSPRNGAGTDSASVQFTDDEDLLADWDSDCDQQKRAVKPEPDDSTEFRQTETKRREAENTESALFTDHKEHNFKKCVMGKGAERNSDPSDGYKTTASVEDDQDSFSDPASGSDHNRTCLPALDKVSGKTLDVNNDRPPQSAAAEAGRRVSPPQSENASSKKEQGGLSLAESWSDEPSGVSMKQAEAEACPAKTDPVPAKDILSSPKMIRKQSAGSILSSPQSFGTVAKSPSGSERGLTKLVPPGRASVAPLTLTEPVFQQTVCGGRPSPGGSSSASVPASGSRLPPSDSDDWDSSSAADDGALSARLDCAPVAVARSESSWGDSSSAGDASHEAEGGQALSAARKSEGESPRLGSNGAGAALSPHSRPAGNNIQLQLDQPASQQAVPDNAAAARGQIQRSASLVGTLGREGTLRSCDEIWAGNDTVSPPADPCRRRPRRPLRRGQRRVSVNLPLSDAGPADGRARRSSSASLLVLSRRAGLLARTGRRLRTLRSAVLAPLKTLRRPSPSEDQPRQSFVSIDSFLSERADDEARRAEGLTADDELEDMYREAASVALQLGDGHITTAQLITSEPGVASSPETLHSAPPHNAAHSGTPQPPPRRHLRRSRSADAPQPSPAAAEWRHLRLSVSSLADIAESEGAEGSAAAARGRGVPWRPAGSAGAGGEPDREFSSFSTSEADADVFPSLDAGDVQLWKGSCGISQTAVPDGQKHLTPAHRGSAQGDHSLLRHGAGSADELQQLTKEAEARISQVRAETDEKLAASQAEAEEKLAASQAKAEEELAAAQAEAEEKLAASQAETGEKLAAAQAKAEEKLAAAQAKAEEKLAASQAKAEEKLAAAQAKAEDRLAAVQEETRAQCRQEEEHRLMQAKEATQVQLEEMRKATEKLCCQEAERSLAEVRGEAERQVKAVREELQMRHLESRAAELAALRSEWDAEAAALRASVEEERERSAEARLTALRTQLESEHRKQNQMVRDAVEKLKVAERAALEAEHKKVLDSKDAEFEDKIRGIREETEKVWQEKFDSYTSELKAASDAAKEDSRREHEEVVGGEALEADSNVSYTKERFEEELRANFESRLLDMAAEASKQQQQIDEYQKKLDNLESKAESQQIDIRRQIEEKLRSEYEEKLHDSEELAASLRKEIEKECAKKHELELGALRSESGTRLEALRAELEAEHQKRTEARIAEVRKDVDSKISATLDQAEATLSQMKDNIEEDYRQKAAMEVAKCREEADTRVAVIQTQLEQQCQAKLALQQTESAEKMERLRRAADAELSEASQKCWTAEQAQRAAELRTAEAEKSAAIEIARLEEELKARNRAQASSEANREQEEHRADEVARVTAEYEQQLAEIRADLLQVQTACQEEKRAAEEEQRRHEAQLAEREASAAQLRSRQSELTSDLGAAEAAVQRINSQLDTWRQRCRRAEAELVEAAPAPVLQRRSSAVQTDWPEPDPPPVPTLRLTVPPPEAFHGSPRPGLRSPQQWEEEGPDRWEALADAGCGGPPHQPGSPSLARRAGDHLENGCNARQTSFECNATVSIFDKPQSEGVGTRLGQNLQDRAASRGPRIHWNVLRDDRPFDALDRSRLASDVGVQTEVRGPPTPQWDAARAQISESQSIGEVVRRRLEEQLRAKCEETQRMQQDLAESCKLIEELTKSVQTYREEQSTSRRLQSEMNSIKQREVEAMERQRQCAAELLTVRKQLLEKDVANGRLEAAMAETSHQEAQLQAKVKDLTFELARAELRNQLAASPAAAEELRSQLAASPSADEQLRNQLATSPADPDAAANGYPSEKSVAAQGSVVRENHPGLRLRRPVARSAEELGITKDQGIQTALEPGRRVEAVQAGPGGASVRPAASEAVHSRQGAVTKRRPAARLRGPSVFPEWQLPAGEAHVPPSDDLTTSEACSDCSGRRHTAGVSQTRLATLQLECADTSRRLAAETARSQQLQRRAASLKSRYRQARWQQQMEAAAAEQARQLHQQLAQEQQRRAQLELQLERLRGEQAHRLVLAELRERDSGAPGSRLAAPLTATAVAADGEAEKSFVQHCEQIQLMSTPRSVRPGPSPGDPTLADRAVPLLPLLPELPSRLLLPDFRAMALAAEQRPLAPRSPSQSLSHRLRRELDDSVRRHLGEQDSGRWGSGGSGGSPGSLTSPTSSGAHGPEDPVERSRRQCLATVVSLCSL